MVTVTFVVARKQSPDGRYPYTILRISENQQEVVSYHGTVEEATEAAHRYASWAGFSGLHARIYLRDWLVEGARTQTPRA
jgi:hypothetical protein